MLLFSTGVLLPALVCLVAPAAAEGSLAAAGASSPLVIFLGGFCALVVVVLCGVGLVMYGIGALQFQQQERDTDTGAATEGKTVEAAVAGLEVVSSPEEEWECCVCLSGVSTEPAAHDEVVQLPDCRHLLHKGCLTSWLQELLKSSKNPACPVCRASVCVPGLPHPEPRGKQNPPHAVVTIPATPVYSFQQPVTLTPHFPFY